MRLIDANLAIERQWFNNAQPLICRQYAVDVLRDAPTVDAVEVVHAHWEDGYAIHNGKEVYQSIDCSHCNEIFKIESHDREYWKKRFKVCPFCGAKMKNVRNSLIGNAHKN